MDEQPDEARFGYLTKAIQSPFKRWLAKFASRFNLLWLAEAIQVAKFRIPDIQDGQFDYVFVHDLFLLPRFSHFSKTRVIFDAREYYPTEFAEQPNWANTVGRLAEYMCKKHMPRCYRAMTVSPSIQAKYRTLIGKEVALFPSFPREELMVPDKTDYVITRPFRFIHHGNAFQNRGLERMIELLALLGDDFQLDMMLVAKPGNQYAEQLKALIAGQSNVNLLEPVHPDYITRVCAEYDAGLYIMEENDSQNRYCLPNKYFEFLYAGLPVITSFSEDMAHYTETYGLGVAFLNESLTQMADKIRTLRAEDFMQYRRAVTRHRGQWSVASNVHNVLPELCGEVD
ncbi:hypothetical protein [Bowmanella sp. JS7-9]|uniref:Uncharacterized protein n=1 Tax=Pseudobowmanella zhangzhouensis TaxID=1537679 RepID=A0ABW1XGZ7_9ALTE|nr:hypothetical protein [Bowmanella sp. JS7-9]TBX25873.1 hypothetical protein TK45_04155 [Bowmanella sp. JS7-9]